MAKRAAFSLAIAAVVFSICSARAATPFAQATGGDPIIVLGIPAGLTVPVNSGSMSSDDYKGFHIHFSAMKTAAVTLTAISGSPTGDTLDTGGLFCTTQIPAPLEVNYGCVALDGQSTTAAGLLVTMTLDATGNGCIRARLVNLPATDPNAPVSDTFTIDQDTNDSQDNAVLTSFADVLVGAGSAGDCALLGSVGGAAADLASPQLATRSDARSFRVLAVELALVALALIGAGWAARRPSAR